MTVRYPDVRRQIFFFVEDLAKDQVPEPQVVSLAAEMLVDFWDLDTDADNLIGNYILDLEKAEVQDVAVKLRKLVDAHGWHLSSDEYSQFPEWTDIKSSAKRAYQRMALVGV